MIRQGPTDKDVRIQVLYERERGSPRVRESESPRVREKPNEGKKTYPYGMTRGYENPTYE